MCLLPARAAACRGFLAGQDGSAVGDWLFFLWKTCCRGAFLEHPLDKKCKEEKNKPGMSKMSGRLFFLPLGAGKPLGAMLLLRAHSRSGSRALGH